MDDKSRRVSWKRRAAAFGIDCSIVGAVWAVIDNVVFFPIPGTLMSMGWTGLFCLYFWVTEARAGHKESLGKRRLGLAVVSQNKTKPPPRALFLRTAVVAALMFPWFELISTSHLIQSSVLLSMSFTIPWTLFVYNGWLAYRGTGSLMLQDSLTSTKVVLAKESEEIQSGSTARRLPEPKAAMIAILVGILAGIFLQGLFGIADPGTSGIEGNVAREVGIRTRASFTTTFVSAEKSETLLEISVFVPMISWRQDRIEKIVRAALSDVKVTPGYYDRGTIKVWTGLEWASSSWVYNFELPPAPR